MGHQAVPAVHWHGRHVAAQRAGVDHGAVHHPAKGGRDHGVHRAAGQGQRLQRPLRTVSSLTGNAAAWWWALWLACMLTGGLQGWAVGTDNATPSSLRFAWVAAYTVSPFGSAERAWKPFNPILGETFELDIGNGVRYLAEQVGGGPAAACDAVSRLASECGGFVPHERSCCFGCSMLPYIKAVFLSGFLDPPCVALMHGMPHCR